MPAVVDSDECTGCGACESICPVECITVDDVALIDGTECTECAACVDECPVSCITIS
jgi:NAD-dependent dihydropyrimidine dehydrogenase PreA subunit